MIKMGKTKYDTVIGNLSTPDIIKKLVKFKAVKYARSIGGLFAEVTGETVELSVAQIIWGLIVEVINVIAEFISCDPFELIENVIKGKSLKTCPPKVLFGKPDRNNVDYLMDLRTGFV